MGNKILEIASLLIYLAIVIVVYSAIRCNNKQLKDPLSTMPLGGENTVFSDILDGWSLSHFTIFALCGIFFSDYFVFIMIMGISWELFEYLTSNSNMNIPLLSWFRGISKCNALSQENRDGHWMYAKTSDIFVNMAGFIVGSAMSNSKLVKHVIKKNNITPINVAVSLTILFALLVYVYNLNIV